MGEDRKRWEKMGKDGRKWEKMGKDRRKWEKMGELIIGVFRQNFFLKK